MGFFQVGFEVTRLPKDTNLSTPMFIEKMKTNANTNDSTAGIRVGIGSSVLQVASSVCSDPSALTSMVSGAYIVTNAWIIGRLLYSPLAASPTVHHRPILALMGTMMAGALAATVLLKPNDDRRALVRTPEPESESSDATNSESL